MEKKGKSAPRYLTLHGPLLIPPDPRVPRRLTQLICLSHAIHTSEQFYMRVNISAYVPVV